MCIKRVCISAVLCLHFKYVRYLYVCPSIPFLKNGYLLFTRLVRELRFMGYILKLQNMHSWIYKQSNLASLLFASELICMCRYISTCTVRCHYNNFLPHPNEIHLIAQGVHGEPEIGLMFWRCHLRSVCNIVIKMDHDDVIILRVTGHLCGEFTGPRWIPHTKASDAELSCFLWSASEEAVEYRIVRLVIRDAIVLIMTSE